MRYALGRRARALQSLSGSLTMHGASTKRYSQYESKSSASVCMKFFKFRRTFASFVQCVRHPRRHRHFLRSGVTSRRRKMRAVISCAANNIQILFISKYNRTEWKKARRRSLARFGNSWVEKFCAYSDSEKCPPFYFMASCTFSKVYGLWAHVHGVWVSTFWAMRF